VKKIAQNVAPNHFLVKFNVFFSKVKIWASSVSFQILAKVKSRSIDENSPNLVTLLGRETRTDEE
jgi:hypothetical protein